MDWSSVNFWPSSQLLPTTLLLNARLEERRHFALLLGRPGREREYICLMLCEGSEISGLGRKGLAAETVDRWRIFLTPPGR